MAAQELQIVRLKDDFYRDGFYQILIALVTIVIACIVLVSVSIYLFVQKPTPVTFSVYDNWRVLPDVPLNQPYITTPDLVQWVSEVIPAALTYDFVNYTTELNGMKRYFTENGWKKFIDQLNLYLSDNFVSNAKLFVNSSPYRAPIILSRGIPEGGNSYSWWIQMPITMNVTALERTYSQKFTIQVFVQRVSTLDNLSGIAIENIIVKKEGD